jgi:hypothetical protein
MPDSAKKPPEAAKPSDNSGCGAVGFCLLLLFYFAATFIPPHLDPEKADIEKTTESRDTIVKFLAKPFPTAEIQLKQLGSFSLEVWIQKKDFESVSYLERRSALKAVGKGWCDLYGGWMLPTVAVRDAKSGKELAAYHCLFHNTTMGEE